MLVDAGSGLFVADTMLLHDKKFPSYQYLDRKTFADIDYGDTTAGASTTDDRDDFLYQSSIFTPRLVLQDFLRSAESRFFKFVSGKTASILYVAAGDRHITIVIDPATSLVSTIDVMYADDMLGDVVRRVEYLLYDSSGRSRYPSHVEERTFGILMNDLRIKRETIRADSTLIVARIPTGYNLAPPAAKAKPVITSTRYNEHIYFFELQPAATRVLLVNFKDYLLIAEAPLSAENGELILTKAHELFPKKQIKYFLFGHHHPWYLGGVRALVHAGVTILSQPQDTNYIRQLVTFTHHLHPDLLEKEPRALRLQTFDSTIEIGDDKVLMQILPIGAMSQHTDDYLMYYFPKYKLLFEDDLIGISKDKPLRAASIRQKGLYDGIKMYGLDVDTIVQSWPVDTTSETIVPFANLEESVRLIKK